LGARYYNASGAQQHALDILKGVGVNYIRLRVWVNPASGYNNKNRVVAFAPQIKSRGLKLLIDLHYSDYWADPGRQDTPAAWRNHSLSQLQTDVYNHTLDVCNSLKTAGATPDMIQVGNEINQGLLWPAGRISNNNFANAAALLKAGYSTVKACSSSTQVALHIAAGGDNGTSRWWFDGMQRQGVQWDVTAESLSLPKPHPALNYSQLERSSAILLVRQAHFPWQKFRLSLSSIHLQTSRVNR
jgi:arabinogalactan endo-1,4-beta-galactosidase